jgi:hypothetical protein
MQRKLIDQLRRRIPSRPFVVGTPPEPLVTFRAAHVQVGSLRVLGDGDELIVEVGELTHGHFACYDEAATPDERHLRVIHEVVGFLVALFEERVLLWAHEANGSGGWEILEAPPDQMPPDQDVNWFLWTGPLRR